MCKNIHIYVYTLDKGHGRVLVKLRRDSPRRACLYPCIFIDHVLVALMKALICAITFTNHGARILKSEERDFTRKWLNPLQFNGQAR